MAADRAGTLLGPPPATVYMFCAGAGAVIIIARDAKHRIFDVRMILNMTWSPQSQYGIALFINLLIELPAELRVEPGLVRLQLAAAACSLPGLRTRSSNTVACPAASSDIRAAEPGTFR